MAPRICGKSFLLTLAVLIILSQLCHAAPNIRGVQFDVYLGAMSDTGNVVGYRGDASEEYDAGVDLPEPPAPLGGYLLLYIDAMEEPPSHSRASVPITVRFPHCQSILPATGP